MNLIIALSSEGDMFYTVNHGKTNAQTFVYFLCKLVKHLNRKKPNWK